MTITSAAIHRPSPLTNYMQHLQQKNLNKQKPTVQPIKSTSGAIMMMRAPPPPSLTTSISSSSSSSSTTASNHHHGVAGGRTSGGRPQQQHHQQQENSHNNNNNNQKLPVWKERQLRASGNSMSSLSPGSARLAMTIQNSNGSSEVRRVPFYPHENPALVDNQQHQHRHHQQQQQQQQHHQHQQQQQQLDGGECDPSSMALSGNVTYVSSSSTESEDARSSSEESHTDHTPDEQEEEYPQHHQQQDLVPIAEESCMLAIVPFMPENNNHNNNLVATVLEDDNINAESLYQELIVRDDNGEPQETDIDTLTQMIDDCAARWRNSARIPAATRRSLVLYNNNSHDAASDVVPPQVRREEIIAQQRAEIKYLRARLASSHDEHTDPSSDASGSGGGQYYLDAGFEGGGGYESPLPSPYYQPHHHYYNHGGGFSPPQPPPPLEQIDSVPIEHIEVAVDHDGDLCSVTSGLTNLVDLSRLPDDATAVSYLLDKSFSRGRPDAEASVCSVQRHHQQRRQHHHHHQHYYEQQQQRQQQQQFLDESLHSHQEESSSSQALQQQQQRRVTDEPLLLRAADGSSRQALYTGPVQASSGHYTGLGVLKFVETGDWYMGQVSNGEMHGQGTYTFAKQKKKRPHKVLRGQFQNNVYVGWNPDAAFWNDTTTAAGAAASGSALTSIR